LIDEVFSDAVIMIRHLAPNPHSHPSSAGAFLFDQLEVRRWNLSGGRLLEYLLDCGHEECRRYLSVNYTLWEG
jgi:hypothetical protein